MEKRVFSIASREIGRYWIGYLVLWSVFLGIHILVDGRSHPKLQLILIAMITTLFIIFLLRYLANQMHRLEVSEQGLTEVRWLLKPIHVDWEAVSSVRTGGELLSFSIKKAFESAHLKSIDGKQIFISGTSRDGAEVIDILKQRLPESVFQAR